MAFNLLLTPYIPTPTTRFYAFSSSSNSFAGTKANFRNSIFTNTQTQQVERKQSEQSALAKDIEDLRQQLETIKASIPASEPVKSNVSTNYSNVDSELANLRKQLQQIQSSVLPTVGSFSTDNYVRTQDLSNYQMSTSLKTRLEQAGYDKNAAEKLAQVSALGTNGRTSSIGWCAKYVNNALENAKIVKKNSTRTASAYQLAKVYAKNDALVEIKVSRDELKNLPAGCIVVWQRGNGFGNAFAKHGHVYITQGNGKATSDYTQNIKDYGTEFTVFVPKKQG